MKLPKRDTQSDAEHLHLAWAEAEIELMRGTIELLEKTLATARAQLRAAERRLSAGTS